MVITSKLLCFDSNFFMLGRICISLVCPCGSLGFGHVESTPLHPAYLIWKADGVFSIFKASDTCTQRKGKSSCMYSIVPGLHTVIKLKNPGPRKTSGPD